MVLKLYYQDHLFCLLFVYGEDCDVGGGFLFRIGLDHYIAHAVFGNVDLGHIEVNDLAGFELCGRRWQELR
jgi:hypothetical protein